MKVKVGGPLAHRWSDGTMDAWTGAEVEVDDNDTEKVDFFHRIADRGMATILVDVAAPAAPSSAPRKAAPTAPPRGPATAGGEDD